MAKIDVSTIEGYEEMTAEEKLAELEGFELPEPDYTGYVKKKLFDKASSETTGYKKQIFEKMTAKRPQRPRQTRKWPQSSRSLSSCVRIRSCRSIRLSS